jgi:ribosomal protein S6--L-glutamate ligase
VHLAVLAAADSWYLADLRRAAAGRHELTALAFRDLQSELGRQIGSSQVQLSARGFELRRLDALLVRSMPPGSLEQVVFRMDLLAQLEAAGVAVFNPPRAIEAAVDKYLASARLAAAGLPVPRTIVCQTPDDALSAFAVLGGDVVVKPLFGSEGRGIARLQDEALTQRAFRMLANLGGVLYVQQFIPHDGFDVRVLVIGQKMFAIRRRNPADWRTNISRGAIAEPIELTAEMGELARRAAAALEAPLAGVDLLPARDGRLYVLEVNAVPGWKALAATLQIDIAATVLEYIERRITA